MKAWEISKPTDGDVHELAANMRSADAEELRAAGVTRLAAVGISVTTSVESYAVRLHGELACLFGVGERPGASLMGGRHGVVWLLGTEVITRYPKLFWQLCKAWMPQLLSRWDTLTNWVHARYAASIRWAARLGGEVGAPFVAGPHGELFHPVVFRRRS